MERQVAMQRIVRLAGIGLAFVVGFGGPTAAIALAERLPAGVADNGVYALATFVVLGALAGVVGRGPLGLVGLWLGLGVGIELLLSAGDLTVFGLPGFSGFVLLVVLFAIAGLGYLLGRAVDPLWSASSARSSSRDETGARQANSRQT